MRRLLIGAAALALSGCAMTSETALFSPADAARPGLAEGHWALHGPGCEVEAGKPLPDCAMPMAIRHGRMEMDLGAFASQYGQAGAAATAGAEQGTDILLVDGDPNILQVSANFGQRAQPGQPPSEKRGYMAIKPLHRDASGRIDKAVLWTIICPKAGQTVDGVSPDNGGKCTASKPEGVRAQAPHLPPLMSFYMTWVRPDDAPAAK